MTNDATSETAGRRSPTLRREQERLFELTMSQGPMVLWTTDTDLRFTSSFGGGLEILDLASDEVVGRSLQEYFQTDDPEFPVIKRHREALDGATGTLVQEWQGNVFESRIGPLRNAQGEIVGVVGLALDVTEQRRSTLVEKALLQISHESQVATDLEAFCAALHGIVGDLMYARNFYLALHDEEKQQLEFPYFVDEHDPTPEPRPLEGGGLTEHVLRGGEPLLASRDLSEELMSREGLEPVGTPSVDWLGVPLKADDRTIGVLVVQSYRDDVRFAERDRDLLTFVSEHIARAIERRRATRAREESLRLLRATIECSGDGILVVDARGRVVCSNERFARMWRIPSDLLAAGDDDRLLAHVLDQLADPEAFLAKVRALYDRPDQRSFDHLALRDGRSFDRYSEATDLGSTTVRVWSFRDVTEQRRAEAQLSRRDRILEAVGSIAEILLKEPMGGSGLQQVVDRLGPASGASRCYVFSSHRGEDGRWLVTLRAEWAGPQVESRLDDPRMQNIPIVDEGFGGWLESLSQGNPISTSVSDLPPEERDRFANSDSSIQSLAVVPIFAGDEPWGYLGFDECHQERAWSSSELDALRAAAGILGASFQRALGDDRLRASEEQLSSLQKMDALGRLAGGLAHDFNNLLTAIVGYGHLTLDQLEPDSHLRPGVQEMVQASEKAATLTGQLLALGRSEALEPRDLDLNELLTGLEGLFPSILATSNQIELDLASPLSLVRADGLLVERIVINLLRNAADALSEGGRLRIATSDLSLGADDPERPVALAPGPYVRLSVHDDGCGMDEATQRQVFEPFFTTKDPGKGTGLGLFTVYEIVRHLGGHVTVESEPGAGSVFRVYFPRVEERTSPAPPRPDRHDGDRAPTILVVDDESGVRGFVSQALQMQGYSVREAEDGQMALGSIERDGVPDLIVTDLRMPHLGGVELADRLSGHSELPFLFISAHAPRLADLARGTRTRFLQKPFSNEVLLETVAELLE